MSDKLSEVVLILVGSTMIILTLTGVIVTSLVISRKRTFRHNMEIANIKNAYEKELLKAQLEIQAQTFESISRELHDNVGTLLSIAMIHSRAMSENGKEANKNLEVQNLLNEAMDTLRDISKSLNPETITNAGWQSSFINELQRAARSNLFLVKTSVTGEIFSLEPSRQIILYRILQEALNNIVKHADASEVCFRLHYNDSVMSVALEDNGKGIDIGEKARNGSGSGLRNMQARAVMLAAELGLETQPGKGTTVTIQLNRN